MSSLSEQYKHLIALSRLYISQEYANPERIICESDSFAFYKAYGFQLRNRSTPVQPSPKPAQTPIAPKVIEPIKRPGPALGITPEKTVVPPEPPKVTPNTSPSPAAKVVPQPVGPTSFTLQPLGKPTELPQEEWRQLMTTHFPTIALSTAIPPDDLAKEQKDTDPSRIRVLIIATEKKPEKMQFLQKLTQAIHERLPTSKLVTIEEIQKDGWNKWLQTSSIRMIIGSSLLPESCPELAKEGILKIEGEQAYLKSFPLLLLAPIDLYLQQGEAKRALWNKLRADLKI